MRSKYRVIRERNRKIPRKYKENGDRKYRGDMKRAGIDTGRSRDDTGKAEDKQKDRSDRSREDKIRFRELRGDTGWKIQGRIGDRCGNVYRQIRRRYKEIWVGRSGMRDPEKSREIQGRYKEMWGKCREIGDKQYREDIYLVESKSFQPKTDLLENM
jgi:hypothetical protein